MKNKKSANDRAFYALADRYAQSYGEQLMAEQEVLAVYGQETTQGALKNRNQFRRKNNRRMGRAVAALAGLAAVVVIAVLAVPFISPGLKSSVLDESYHSSSDSVSGNEEKPNVESPEDSEEPSNEEVDLLKNSWIENNWFYIAGGLVFVGGLVTVLVLAVKNKKKIKQ